MIATSAAYKRAIAENAPQRALIRFKDAVFTNEDISITSGGISFSDRLNEESELTFGVAPSNSISIALINEDGLLKSYSFGRFTAHIGTRIEEGQYAHIGNVTVEVGIGGKRFTGRSNPPYLLENGDPCSIQPDFPVKSIVVVDSVVYCFGSSSRQVIAFKMDGSTWDAISKYTWDELSDYQWRDLPVEYVLTDVPFFITHTHRKMQRLIEANTGVVVYGDTVVDFYSDGSYETYEYVPLGTFIAPKPEQTRSRVITIEADDLMQLLEAPIDDIKLDDFPLRLRVIARRICLHHGLDFTNDTFIGYDMVVAERPEAFNEATQREVIAWIAEVACSYAKFNRYGVLEFKWFGNSETVFSEGNYKDFTPFSYKVQKVGGVKIRNGNSDVENSYGSSKNVYLIQDNPFLRPDDSSTAYAGSYSTRAGSHPILDRASSLPEFYPASGTFFGDPSVEAGDILTVESGADSFKTPVFSATTQWNGTSMLTLENSGSESRPAVAPLEERRKYAEEKKQYSVNKSVSGSISSLGGKTATLEEEVKKAWIDINQHTGTIEAHAQRISLNAEEIELRAKIVDVTTLVADAIEAAIADFGYTISESISTDKLTVDGNAWVLGTITVGTEVSTAALKIGGSSVSKTTIPVVTEFTQALGESAETTDYTLLTTAVGEEISHDVAEGETITF